jgi:hypothetical protein
MKPIDFDGVTRRVGKGQGYEELPLQDQIVEDGENSYNFMASVWSPTEEELEHIKFRIANGLKLHFVLSIVGTQMPPVLLYCGTQKEH